MHVHRLPDIDCRFQHGLAVAASIRFTTNRPGLVLSRAMLGYELASVSSRDRDCVGYGATRSLPF